MDKKYAEVNKRLNVRKRKTDDYENFNEGMSLTEILIKIKVFLKFE